MIGLVGHADLTSRTLELLEAELPARLRGAAEPPDPVLVRVGAGLPVVCGRAARRAGLPLVVVLPAEGALPVPLPEQDRTAAGELLLLADQARLLPFVPGERDECVRADEELIRCCRTVVAVWDGSPSNGRDATAHLVAYARSHSIPVEILWPAGAERILGPAGRPRGSGPQVPRPPEAAAPAVPRPAPGPAPAGHRFASATDRTV